MAAKLINSTEAWRDLRDDWDELVARSSFPSVFATFDYLWTAFRTFHQHDSELFLIAIHDPRGELIGIAPFRRSRCRQHGFTLRVLEYVTTWEVDKPYPIFKTGCEGQCWNEIHRFLERHRAEWDVLELMEVPDDMPATAAIRQLFRAPAYQVDSESGPTGPIIDLTQTWAQFLAAHPKYARALRRLGGVGSGYQLRAYDSADSLEAGIQAYLGLERSSWKDGRHGLRKNSLHAQFYEHVLRAPSDRRRATILTLAVDDDVVAGVICWEFGDTVYVHHTVYDPAFARHSPGTMLMGLALGHYMDRGRFRCADLLCGFADFYHPWATRVVGTSQVRVYRHSLKVRMALWLGRAVNARAGT